MMNVSRYQDRRTERRSCLARIFRKFLACLTLASLSLSSALAAQALVLQLETADELGREAKVQVVTPGCRDLVGFSFDLNFDPELLFVNAVEGVDLLAGMLVESEALRPGLISISVSSEFPITGRGSLVELHFEAYSPEGGSSRLVLAEARARARAAGSDRAVNLPVEVRQGKVTMAAEQKSWSSWGGYLLLAVASLLLVLLVVAKLTAHSGNEREEE